MREAYNVLHDLGANPDRLISASGLNPGLFEDGNNLVPFVSVGQLIADCARETECGHFGLLIGARAHIDSLGLVGAVMRNSATVGAALAELEAHLGIQNRGAVPYLEVSEDLALFCFLPYKRGMVGAGLYSEGGLATTVSVLRDLAGPEWSPLEVLIPRKQPSRLDSYWHFFRAPVRFDQEIAALVFPASLLETPIPGADPDLLRELMTQVRFLGRDSDRSVSDRLRRLIRRQLVNAHCTVDSIAHSLDLNRRTLNRRLRAEGTTVRRLMGEVRFEVACQLISDTELGLSAIAAALDFSEPAAFNHAFRRWAGCTPTEWRNRVEREPFAVPSGRASQMRN
ncbi:AraC family transcriptional regulator [Microbaculum sp. FT89]|uniref:AraC family transcriptional regulator n=1 Tax=Microbaculum sp. FT89 TaxID=3447298 RepID=UPI003F52B713